MVRFCRILGLVAVLALLPVTFVYAVDHSPGSPPGPGMQFPPQEFGRIVYQKYGHLPQQIYIIGQTHRSPLSGKGDADIVRVQADVYRIGEWLIREKRVGMLLPEGFFRVFSEGEGAQRTLSSTFNLHDNRSLEERLADTRYFVNADLLLKASFNIPFGQIENERLYQDIYRLLLEAKEKSSPALLSKLYGLQVQRTARMLQNIPVILEEAFQAGTIGNRTAIFTVGLGHVREIIEILRQGYLWLPTGTDHGEEVKKASLTLLEQGYGVTVILPRSLAENEKILNLARLSPE